MSSATHSLSFSPPTLSHQKRNSLTVTQLPLPDGLIANQRPSQPSSVPTTPRLALPSSSRLPDINQPQSPTLLSYSMTNNAPQTHHTSSTHAGGIQPAAAFFRPSRPIYQPQYSRPGSPSSMNAPQDDAYPLDPLSHSQHNHGSEADSIIDIGETTESMRESHQQTLHNRHHHHSQHQQPRFISLKRIKKSREPLLPGPSLSKHQQSSSSRLPPAGAAGTNTSRIVRNSLDRVLSISRGLSFDSIRKSSSSKNVNRLNNFPPIPHSGDTRHTFETKLSDNDNEQQYELHKSSHLSRPASPITFNPIPPTRRPPLSAVPVFSPDTHRPLRKYQVHPSRNRFFLGGRLLTGGDTPWAFLATFILILSISGVWFGTTAVWWWRNVSPAVAAVGSYMALLTISTMLATASLDPGILPRNLDPDPPYPSTSPSDGGLRAPMPRDLKVRSDVVRVKYCPTCKTYRPPRSSHCKMCDNCVDGCDHHCQWVNNCIGRRNYTTFFSLLFFATTTLILIICTSALHLFFVSHRDHVGFRTALGRAAGSAVVFCMAIAVIWPVAALLSYHLRLLLLNVTTIEQIRNQAHKTLVSGPPPPNPFSHGSWRRNFLAVLCRPQGFSWLDATGVVTKDKREVNPGNLMPASEPLSAGGAAAGWRAMAHEGFEGTSGNRVGSANIDLEAEADMDMEKGASGAAPLVLESWDASAHPSPIQDDVHEHHDMPDPYMRSEN